MQNCVDLWWKLDWEIAGLCLREPHDVIDMKYFAFNAAVTAWTLTDWVFEDMTLAQRSHHRVRSQSEFQKLARDQCRALHLCRQVATASKHRTVDKYPDPSVSAGVNVRPGCQTICEWEIVITDGTTTRLAVDVLEEAKAYWYRFIPKLGLLID